MTKKTKTSKGAFYNIGGIWLIILSLMLILALVSWGLYELGVVDLPEIFSPLFEGKPAVLPNAPAANIANEPAKEEAYVAVPREEFALALGEMKFPNEYYRNYKITIKSYASELTTEYYSVKDGDDWWVQSANGGVIMQTAICTNGVVTVTDNAANTSSETTEASKESPSGISFEDRCGIMSLETLVDMIHTLASGEKVAYGGGIVDYSLSFTQTRTSGENLFSFSFICQNGVSEEYTFSFENAVILSASKSYDGAEIYKMEIKDYRNTLDEINIDSLFSVD